MESYSDASPKAERRRTVITALVIPACLVTLLFILLPIVSAASLETATLPVSLHSARDAVYGFDDAGGGLPAVSLNIVRDAILDQQTAAGAAESDIESRLVTVTAVLLAPIPSATPRPTDPASRPDPAHIATVTATIMPTPTPATTKTPTTSAGHTPTPTATPTGTNTATRTPAATATGSSTPTGTATATATETLTPTPAGSSKPTATLTPTPSETPTPTLGAPVCVDPITISGRLPSDDTYIDAGKPSANYGDNNRILVRADNGSDLRALIRFDLSDIPAGATINSSTLYLYGNHHATDQVIFVYHITADWNEESATWQSWATPGGDFDGSAAHVRFIPEQNNRSVAVQLTELVQQWADGSLLNNGVLLYATGANHIFSFTAREDASNIERVPELAVDFTAPRRPPPAAAMSSISCRAGCWRRSNLRQWPHKQSAQRPPRALRLWIRPKGCLFPGNDLVFPRLFGYTHDA